MAFESESNNWFTKLKKHWHVSTSQAILIIVTFALGGSSCGYLSRKILNFIDIDSNAIRLFFYLILVTLLWPFCVIIISIPLNQFSFFKSYLLKIKQRIFKN